MSDTTEDRIRDALRDRDAQWRDALRGNFGSEFWSTCGPQNPKEAAVFERQADRVDSRWRAFMMAERDKMRDMLKELIDVAQMALDHEPGDSTDDGCRDALDSALRSARSIVDHQEAGDATTTDRPTLQRFLWAEAGNATPGSERWGFATHPDSEFWRGATSRQHAIEGALLAAKEAGDEDGADGAVEGWIQKGTLADPLDYIADFQKLTEDMRQSAIDNGNCPDEVEDEFHYAQGAQEALETALHNWTRQYVTANWWIPVGAPERVTATTD